MYERFFGLRERPFDLVPNPRFLFLTAGHREALSTLRYGLSGPGGLTLLLGEAGTGKTTLVQTALSEIPGDVECVLLSNPTLKREEFYEFLSTALRFDHGVAQSKAQFLTTLREHLEERHMKDLLTAIIVDEAQCLPDELVEEIRLLSNIETNTAKLLNVILVGQPELANRLNEPHLRQLKQRIALRCQLHPFDVRETAAYIAGRLRIAGGSPVEIFTREAVEAIYGASKGISRVINVICENALISGFASQTKPVSRALVSEVIRDFDLDRNATAPAVAPEAAPAPAEKIESGPTDMPSSDSDVPADGSALLGNARRRKRFSFF